MDPFRVNNNNSTRKPPIEQGTKHDSGKPPLSLLSYIALAETAKVLEFGAQKYAAHNWRGGLKVTRLMDAALRHLLADASGERLDPESGLPHLAHALCSIMFALETSVTHPHLDDRYSRP